MYPDAEDRIIGPHTRLEAGVHGTIRVQTGDVIKSHTIYVGEQSADQDFTIRLQRDRPHRSIGPNTNGIKVVIHGAVRIQPSDMIKVGGAII